MFEEDNLFLKQKDNPFSQECKDCIKNIWEHLLSKNLECSQSINIIIEKLKDD